MKQVFSAFLLLLLMAGLITGCDESSVLSTQSSGSTSEIMVVTKSAEVWKGSVGDTIRAYFAQNTDGLPQPEPLFDLMQAPLGEFNKNQIFKQHHSIFIADIDPSYAKTEVVFSNDIWSKPQLVLTIKAGTDTAFFSALKHYFPTIEQKFRDSQLSRTLNFYRVSQDSKTETLLKTTFGFNSILPSSFSMAVNKPDLIWLRQSIHRTKQDTEIGLLFYSADYSDTSQLSQKSLMALRDSIGKKYIFGPTEGSYMLTENDVIPVKSYILSNPTSPYVRVSKGLWAMAHDFMGGPFVQYAFLSPDKKKIICAEGYIYNPNGEKRNMMIQVESILRSIEFVTPEKK